MANNKFSKGGLSGFLSGKGFYIALAICLIGAGSAAWVAVDKTMDAVNEPGTSNISYQEGSNSDWNLQDSNAVDQNQTQVPESSSSSTSSTQQQSSGEQSEQSQQSEKPASSSAQQVQQQEAQSSLYVLPVQGEILAKYSEGELVKNETLGEWRTHDGIDISAALGTDVLSCADGKVLEVTNDPLWGTCVTVEHSDNVVSCYKGLDTDVLVKAGDEIKINDIIGTVGSSNLAEKSENGHLHFEMKKDGKFTNPLEVMDMLSE